MQVVPRARPPLSRGGGGPNGAEPAERPHAEKRATTGARKGAHGGDSHYTHPHYSNHPVTKPHARRWSRENGGTMSGRWPGRGWQEETQVILSFGACLGVPAKKGCRTVRVLGGLRPLNCAYVLPGNSVALRAVMAAVGWVGSYVSELVCQHQALQCCSSRGPSTREHEGLTSPHRGLPHGILGYAREPRRRGAGHGDTRIGLTPPSHAQYRLPTPPHGCLLNALCRLSAGELGGRSFGGLGASRHRLFPQGICRGRRGLGPPLNRKHGLPRAEGTASKSAGKW